MKSYYEMKAEKGKPEVVITSVFDASRSVVYSLYTDPALISHWWGPRWLSTSVDKMDVKPGGLWRFVQQDSEGNEYAFHGVYHSVIPDECLVYTFEFEGVPGHVVLETISFEDLPGGKTKMVDQSIFQSLEDRDGMIKAGMEEGISDSINRLAELLTRGDKLF